MGLFGNSRGITIQDKQIDFRRELGSSEQKFIGKKQELEVVAVSHWLQGVVTTLLLGQGGIFLLLEAGDKFLHEKCPLLPSYFLSAFFLLMICLLISRKTGIRVTKNTFFSSSRHKPSYN